MSPASRLASPRKCPMQGDAQIGKERVRGISWNKAKPWDNEEVSNEMTETTCTFINSSLLWNFINSSTENVQDACQWLWFPRTSVGPWSELIPQFFCPLMLLLVVRMSYSYVAILSPNLIPWRDIKTHQTLLLGQKPVKKCYILKQKNPNTLAQKWPFCIGTL